jgi:hypothetical protein
MYFPGEAYVVLASIIGRPHSLIRLVDSRTLLPIAAGEARSLLEEHF